MKDQHHRAIQHLLLRLQPINRMLRSAARQVSRASTIPVQVRAGALSLEEIEYRLAAVESRAGSGSSPPAFEKPEVEREAALRAASDLPLPLDLLRSRLGFDEFDTEAILLCAAAELDRRYAQIFGFVLDDLGRGAPCVELLCSLSARSVEEAQARRVRLAPHARLIRYGVLRLGADAGSEWKREVRLSPLAQSFLWGDGIPAEQFRDCDEVDVRAEDLRRPWGIEAQLLERAGKMLGDPGVTTISVHGDRESSRAEVPRALAARARRPLRRVSWGDPVLLAAAVVLAERLQAILWVDAEGLGGDPAADSATMAALEQLGGRGPHLIITSKKPVRPLGLMVARPWIEIPAQAPSLAEAATRWADELPEVPGEIRADLALRYRLSPVEIQAAAGFFRAGTQAGAAREELERACRTVSRRQTERFATVVTPVRRAEDLVLPQAVHERVMDVSRFARAWPEMAERWGIGRGQAGGRGIRAFFTGPPGTGKTLAAEVIAGTLGQELHKIDLASLVSKWVGETEKNLDAAFREAEQSQAVLFFDEADALFAKRGEVKHGMDRYANLEVSYLLQRLEDYAGVVICASNLKENLDEAFSRRFHIMVDFPKPAEAERRRMWALAIPSQVPQDGLDLQAFANLEMTGATIMNAARTAMLLAASNGQVVHTEHVIEGITREYRRENRILLPTDIERLRAGATA